jgi:hypothetical protein
MLISDLLVESVGEQYLLKFVIYVVLLQYCTFYFLKNEVIQCRP